MKTFTKFFGLALVAFYSIFFSSCNNNSWDPKSVPVDYYTSGYSGVGPAAHSIIYKNGEVLYDLSDGYTISCVEYASKNVFAGGTYFDGSTDKAVILKNGIPSNTSLAGKCDIVVDMISNGTDVFSCGNLKDGASVYGVILKGDTQVYKSTEACEFKAIDMGASGDLYVVAENSAEIKLLRINGSDYTVKSTELVAKQEAGNVYTANDLFVGNRDISIALTATRPDAHYACNWLSGVLFDLAHNPSQALCTTFFNGYCIVGGSWNESLPYAVQWYNIRVQDYSYDCNPNSSVNCVYNSGCYLHQAIQSDGQIQLCCNGALAYKITCDMNFQVTSMVVINR